MRGHIYIHTHAHTHNTYAYTCKRKGALTCSIPDLSTLLFELIVHDICMEIVIQSIVCLYIYTALMYMDPWIYDQLPLHIRQVVGVFE